MLLHGYTHNEALADIKKESLRDTLAWVGDRPDLKLKLNLLFRKSTIDTVWAPFVFKFAAQNI